MRLRFASTRSALLRRLPLLACLAAGGFVAAWAVAVAASPDGGMPPLPIDVAAPNPPLDKPPATTVRIVITVLPSSTKKAMVFWGKKRLGLIAPHAPLIVQRPRDSGPLDLVVKSDGCLPVQTRAYTFGDSKLSVKLTPVDQKSTLLGYREELPPSDGGAPAEPDGGTP